MPVVTGEELAAAIAPSRRDELIVELFQTRGAALVGLARTLVDTQEEAEEVVQDAFERLVASFVRIDDAARAERYLTVTTLNLARSRLRRRRTARDKAHLLVSDESADPAPSGGDDERAVRIAIQSLSKRQQQCVVLRFYSGRSEREIAETLGVRIGSVKQHLSRARATLATTLEGRR
jgi:RNA polymerase sigma factor (sigma-70 family)